ncbi:SHOCT domain-containing protein [Kitasatospora sp. NPDC002227]|uniref:SHOCT domain-containing protein n=1 Tax=Kitasatospora sp. NPDC002227 TaxID=3154773 RepID=UPI00331B0895
MMYWNDHDMNGWGIGLMTFGTLLLLGLLIVAVVVLLRYAGHAPHHHPVPPAPPVRPEPEQLLAERLARGEIDTDEYRRRLDALRDGRGQASG